MTESRPLVGIGLPVMNGEKWIAETVDSIQRQTWPKWELVIVDNASTDGTLELCRRLEREDSRIRVSQNPQNIGVSANWNRAFHLSRGEYFKWSACADLIAPEYLEACVSCLERRPDAVLCQSRTLMIDAAGHPVPGYDDSLVLEATSPAARFVTLMLRLQRNNSVHGLIRRSSLDATRLMEGFRHDDINLIADLALRGTFALVDKPLFFRRETAQTDTQRMSREEIDRYFIPDQHRPNAQTWKKLRSLVRIAATAPTSMSEKGRTLAWVARTAWWSKTDLFSEIQTSMRGLPGQPR